MVCGVWPANLKRKPRLSKFVSYKAAYSKEVQFRLKFCVVLRIAHTTHRYISEGRLLLLVVLGGHVDSTGCLGARKCF